MRQTDERFRALMQDVLTGSETAAQELFRDYEQAILHAVRRRLNKRIRSMFDSQDFAQDVWSSFFKNLPERTSFDTPRDLVAFLTTLARNKVVDANRQRLGTQKFDVKREQSLDDSQRFDKDNLPSLQATPSQITMGKEEWLKFLGTQPPVYRRIFILLRDGQSPDDIAAELNISARTVQRVVTRFASRASA